MALTMSVLKLSDMLHEQGAQWAANKMWDFPPKNVGI